MPNIARNFNGKLNLDTQNYRVPSADWVDALNITRDAQGPGQDGPPSNILGNTLIPYTKPSGTNKRIGHHEDKTRNRIYGFFWNSTGKHYINYLDNTLGLIVKVIENLTDTGNVDVLGFNPSFRINHVDILYRPEGDLLYWTDNLNPPSKINITLAANGGYGLIITRSFLDVAKDMPLDCPRVVYENDNTLTVNNVKNSLFQFAQCWGYNDFEYSAYSTASEVPLPFAPMDQSNDSDPTKNARIAVYVYTGDSTVKKIRVVYKQTKNGATSNYFALDDLVKSDLGIADNSVYKLLFFNSDVAIPVDVKLGSRIFDYVPLKANAQSLANGNSLVYGATTEGYDQVFGQFASSVTNSSLPYNTYNGILFFGKQDSSTQMTIFLTGMGVNSGNNPSVLANLPERLYVHAKTPAGVDKSFLYDAFDGTISTILTGLQTAAVAQGFSFVSMGTNTLTLSFTGGITYDAAGLQRLSGVFNNNDVSFAYANAANYKFGVVYFDKKGRTNQVVTSVTYKVKTVEFGIPVITLQISSTPPLWAYSYHFVRSNDLTYNKRLFWVSTSAYSEFSNTTNLKYAYVGIENIYDFNLSVSASSAVVGYEFSQGDRISFNSRIQFYGTTIALTNKDYEILGVETNVLINGQVKNGTYIKILYPTADIDANFSFDGSFDFQNYQIFVYNYKEQTADKLNVYYEFGKNFPVGNPGLTTAYHICQNQTQDLANNLPASIDITEGDYFYRRRFVPIGGAYYYDMPGYDNGMSNITTIPINVPSNLFATPYYKFGTELFGDASFSAGSTPHYSDGALFENISTQDIRLRLRASLVYTNNIIVTDFSIDAKMINAASTVVRAPIFPNNGGLVTGANNNVEVDTVITVPVGYKLFLLQTRNNSEVWVQGAKWRFDVLNNYPIFITENSFSDTYAIRTNSNSRPFIVDKDAKQTFYPATVRFGLEIDQDTNINQTNVFYADNTDTYDRSFGSIMKMFIRGRRLYIFQQFEIGVVPVLTQIVRDTKDNPLEANSDILLNKITYPYEGKWGIGDTPESFAFAKGNMYFVDSNKGVVCRLGQDGVIALSVRYETNAFFIEKLAAYKKALNTGFDPVLYTGNPCVYGVFDQYTNRYIIAGEVINRYSGVGSLAIVSTLVVPNRLVAFAGVASPGVTITLAISAANGNAVTVQYTTVVGDTPTSIRSAFRVLINAGTLFTATSVLQNTIPGFPTNPFGYPAIRINNVSASQVSVAITQAGTLLLHQDPFTISFLETRGESEGFESFYSYNPEGMVTLDNLLVSFKNGDFYRHDSLTFCNFYGVQYGSSITLVFNDHSVQKKTWKTVTELANTVWAAPVIESQLLSYGSTPQQSSLINQDFEVLESDYHAAFLSDKNSIGGLIDGDDLKGNYLIVKFQVTSAPNLVFLNGVIVKYIDSSLNVK
jgi:hypothetical protein